MGSGLLPPPPPPAPRVFKRKERLLVKSFVIFAVSPATAPSDTHSLAPAARPPGERTLRQTPLETCRAEKRRREPDQSGTVQGCDWHPVLRLGSGLREVRSRSAAGAAAGCGEQN